MSFEDSADNPSCSMFVMDFYEKYSYKVESETFKANYNVYPQMRSIYERTLTMSYNGNNATGGSTTSQTTTQYYSSGYVSSGKNYKEQISSPSITLAT